MGKRRLYFKVSAELTKLGGKKPTIYLETASTVAEMLEEILATATAALLTLGVAFPLWCISAKL